MLLPLDWPYECCEPWRAHAPDTVAGNPRQNDAISQLHPLDLYTRERLRRLELPLWNPWLGGGIPHLATGFTRALYPPFWLTLPLPDLQARNLEVFLHVVLAGLLQFLWLRRLGCGPPAALLGGMAFAFSGALAVRLPLGYVHQTLVWLPGLLWGIEGVLRARPRAVAWLAGVAALQLLAGSLPDVLSSWLFALLYLGGRLAGGAARRRGGARRVWLGVGGAVTLAALLAAAQLLPHLELVSLSQRGERTLEELRSGGIPLAAWLTLASPAAFGSDSGRDYWLATPSPGVQLYVGFVALAGGVFFLRGRRARRALPVLIATLGVWLIAAGSPLLDLVALLLPPLRGLRYVYTFSNACAAGLAALGALGLDRLLRDPRARRGTPRLAVGVAAVALVLLAAGVGDSRAASVARECAVGVAGVALVLGVAAAGGRLGRAGLAAALLLVSAVDVVRYPARENPAVDPARFPPWPASPALSAIAADPDPGRVLSVTRGEAPWPPGPNTLYGWGLADAGAYHSLLPQRLVRYFTVMQRLFEGTPPREALAGGRVLFNALEAHAFRSNALARLLRIGYVVLPSDARPVTRERLVRVSRDDLRVYRHLDALPRAFVAPRHERAESPEAALARIVDPGFEPLDLAVVEEPLETGPPEPGPVEQMRVLREAPERLELEVSSGGGVLVVCDAAYPGWRAWLDGDEVPLLRVDYLFRGLALPAGAHRVRMRFEPLSWRVGRGISLVALPGLALLAWRSGRRRRVAAGGETA